MSHRNVVVIGASAGGLEPLIAIVSRLPAQLSACVLVAVHSQSDGMGALPEILARSSALPVQFARTDDPVVPGRIYVARPDRHLVVTPRGVRVVNGPRENGFRPAIDPLFRTAAREFGSRVIGVVLSGALADGTYGLSVVKQHGGLAIAQEPNDAIIPSMPLNAIKYVDVDFVLAAVDIGPQIAHLTAVDEEREGAVTMPRRTKEIEPQTSSHETEVSEMQDLFGPASALTCPDCGGALWEVQEGRVVRYQCHVGHQYAPENLEDGQRDVIDYALWSAVRVLEEHADLKSRMAARATAGGLMRVSQGFSEGARDAHEQAQRIRGVLLDFGNGTKGKRAPAGASGTQQTAVAAARATRKKPRPRTRTRRSSRKAARR